MNDRRRILAVADAESRLEPLARLLGDRGHAVLTTHVDDQAVQRILQRAADAEAQHGAFQRVGRLDGSRHRAIVASPRAG